MSQNVLTSLDYEIVVTRVSPASSLQDWRSSADTLKVSAQIRDQVGKCDTRLARFTDRFGHTKLDGLWSYMTIYHRTLADVYVCTMFHLVKRGFIVTFSELYEKAMQFLKVDGQAMVLLMPKRG